MSLPSPDALITLLQELGWLAIPACLVLMTVSAVVPIPAELPAMLNGAVLGLWTGSAVTWCGAMCGAWISFRGAGWLHKRFGQRWLGARGQERVAALGQGTGVVELIVLRLTPIVAFHLVNYAAGIARIPAGRFLWTTALGIVPGVFAFTASGMAVAHWMSHPAVKWGALVFVIVLVGWRLRRRG
ncbi:MAG: TVP38/TMEM64 family protein [Gemmatimonadetes bacterium]|nr:TVP38/TMEM64 family protein [Gemmatimonadota bacterium]